MPWTLLIALLIFASTSFADSDRHIVIAPTKGSITYSASRGSSGCGLNLNKPMGATIVNESKDAIQVSFDEKQIHGCYWEFMGADSNTGWISKKEISYKEDSDEEDDDQVQIVPPKVLEITVHPKKKDCPPGRLGQDDNSDIDSSIQDVGALITHIRAKDSGMKSLAEVKEYIGCYPLSSQGTKNLAVYSPFMDQITNSFSIQSHSEILSVNPSLYRCLLRRESGFDPDSLSFTGAAGIGQHTNINIEHISKRISNSKTWEHKLWNQFFQKIQQQPQGRALLKSCKADQKNSIPTFKNKKSASCPLQSLAASAIYILEIQQALMRNSSSHSIAWDKDLEYQLAIGASYNLGDGAAGKAVDDLVVDGWVDAIKNKPSTKQKKEEVKHHITALKNCLEDKNWKPMTPGDHPVCSHLPK